MAILNSFKISFKQDFFPHIHPPAIDLVEMKFDVEVSDVNEDLIVEYSISDNRANIDFSNNSDVWISKIKLDQCISLKKEDQIRFIKSHAAPQTFKFYVSVKAYFESNPNESKPEFFTVSLI